MLRTLPQTRDFTLVYRLIGVAVCTLVTVISARIQIPMDPVPFTFQPFAVLLAGMVLGWRDGVLSQALYVALIALNLPVDANMRGSAALFGPTGGYLIGFVVAAGVVGLMVERGAKQLWVRWLAGVAGVAVIYVFGVAGLMLARGMDLATAFTAGAAPFLVFDLIKALISAGATESARALLLRTQLPPTQ
jgi:biotin transport system substrate-specific component